MTVKSLVQVADAVKELGKQGRRPVRRSLVVDEESAIRMIHAVVLI